MTTEALMMLMAGGALVDISIEEICKELPFSLSPFLDHHFALDPTARPAGMPSILVHSVPSNKMECFPNQIFKRFVSNAIVSHLHP